MSTAVRRRRTRLIEVAGRQNLDSGVDDAPDHPPGFGRDAIVESPHLADFDMVEAFQLFFGQAERVGHGAFRSMATLGTVEALGLARHHQRLAGGVDQSGRPRKCCQPAGERWAKDKNGDMVWSGTGGGMLDNFMGR